MREPPTPKKRTMSSVFLFAPKSEIGSSGWFLFQTTKPWRTRKTRHAHFPFFGQTFNWESKRRRWANFGTLKKEKDKNNNISKLWDSNCPLLPFLRTCVAKSHVYRRNLATLGKELAAPVGFLLAHRPPPPNRRWSCLLTGALGSHASARSALRA